jgi:hypothetical protein
MLLGIAAWQVSNWFANFRVRKIPTWTPSEFWYFWRHTFAHLLLKLKRTNGMTFFQRAEWIREKWRIKWLSSSRNTPWNRKYLVGVYFLLSYNRVSWDRMADDQTLRQVIKTSTFTISTAHFSFVTAQRRSLRTLLTPGNTLYVNH